MIDIVINDKQLQRGLRILRSRMSDLTPLMRRVAGIMADSVEENFSAQGRPSWKPLKPKTIKARERKGYTPIKILTMSGRLATSITRDYGSDYAQVGTNLRYAAAHQFGFKGRVTVKAHHQLRQDIWNAGEKEVVPIRTHSRLMNLPARPFLALGDDARQDILQAVRREISNAAGGGT